MSVSVITLGGNSVTLVSTPTKPGLRSISWDYSDAVAIVSSPFTGQMQAQQWPGADQLRGTATLPPLTQVQADDWISFLMECRGMANAFQMGDPLKPVPRGSVAGSPLVDNTASNGNVAGSSFLGTKGWTANAAGVLLRGDWMQVGYRLYRVLENVYADSTGRSIISIWPALRELPVDSSTIVTTGAQGLFRLADNKRTATADVTRLTRTGFMFMEYR